MSNNKCANCFTCQKEGNVKRNKGVNRKRGKQQMQPLNINSLTVFPTNHCNFRCDYCFIYRYERNFGKNMNMTFDTAKRIVKWLMATSNAKQVKIHWFGGEPLVAYPLIKRITEWADKEYKGMPRSVKWGMTSNLSLITDDVNAFLKKYNYNVLCSVDGMAKDHDKWRVYAGNKGTWDDVIAGLDRLLEWKDKSKVTIRWTVSPSTGKTIVEGTKYFINKGINTIAQEFVYEDTWDKIKIARVEASFTELIPYIVDLYVKEGRKIDLKAFRDGLRAFEPSKRMSNRCGLANGDLGVDVDGNLFNCHRFVDQEDFHIGSVWKGIDKKAANKWNTCWSHSKIKAWDGTWERCLTCAYKMGCNAGCIAVNYDTNGTIFQPPRAYCDIQLMKVRLAYKFMKALQKANKWKEWNSNKRGKVKR